MTNLIKKIFSKRQDNGPAIERNFYPEQIKPVFEKYGINIDEKIGDRKFPFIEDRNNVCDSMAFNVRFSDITITPAMIDGKMSTIITGKYFAKAAQDEKDSHGHYIYGAPSLYSFKIQDNKLNFKRLN